MKELLYNIIPDFIIQSVYRNFTRIKFKTLISKGVKVNMHNTFEGGNSISAYSEVINSSIGYGTYIGSRSEIRFIKTGRFCAIGDNVRTCLGVHPTKDYVSIHPAFFSIKKQAGFTFSNKQSFEEHTFLDQEKKYVVQLGNDVWIGNNVMIMDGVKIGDGAVVAGGAVVTKNVSPYSIVGGVPAKEIKKRFDEASIESLLKIKWWEKDKEWLVNNAKDFRSIEMFIDKHITI